MRSFIRCLMVKIPTVSVYFDLTKKKQSWLEKFWTRTHAATKELTSVEFLLRVKDFCKLTVHISFVCLNLHELICYRQTQLHFYPPDNHHNLSACKKLKLSLQKKWQGKKGKESKKKIIMWKAIRLNASQRSQIIILQ